MPLYDHFRSPLWTEHAWTSLHGSWAVSLMSHLNRVLPRHLLAEVNVKFGGGLGADVAEFDRGSGPERNGVASPGPDAGGGGTAVAVAAPATYAPPVADLSIPVTFSDEVEVMVFDVRGVRRLAAVIELVSPANKDRPAERDAFAHKCLGYLKAGVGLVVVDIVTTMHFNLHDEVVRAGRFDKRFLMPGGPGTYAVAYRPIYRDKRNVLDVWRHELRVGAGLPGVPLAVKGYGCVPLDLDGTYTEACVASRIP